MKKNERTFKVVSDDLNVVLCVRGFELEEEKDFYLSIRKKISDADQPVSVESYQKFIVQKFLVDSAVFLDSLPDDEDEGRDIISSAYAAIINLYPPFSLEYVCADLNADTFMEGAHGKVLKKIQEHAMAEKFNSEGMSIQLSSIEDIRELEGHLLSNIVGQRQAVDALIKSLKLMASGLSKQSSFLFVGPTGVGKTQLAKLLGEEFSGNFYKINCAEYANQHEYAKLIGAPPGYVGHTDKSLLGEKAEQSNKWVFLFDEIEKAHHKLYDFLLSLLDDGTCTDNLGTVLDFSESIFVFTSNQGVGDLKRDQLGFDRTQDPHISRKVTAEVIRNSVKKHFTPEFLNRLDDIIYFNPLRKQEVREIASLELDVLPIVKTDALIDYVVEGGYSAEYGARNICRFIKNNVSIKVADAILNKLVPKNEKAYYTPRIVQGEVKIINTQRYQTSSL